jgi:hypothetical protein
MVAARCRASSHICTNALVICSSVSLSKSSAALALDLLEVALTPGCSALWMHLHVASNPYTARRCSPVEARSTKGLALVVAVAVVAVVLILEEDEDMVGCWGAHRACRAMA